MDNRSTLSFRISEFALSTNFSGLPEAVEQTARAHFLDTLGIAVASSVRDFGRSIIGSAVALEGDDQYRPEVTAPNHNNVVGTRYRLSPQNAALANGALMHGLDFDDTLVEGVYHPSASTAATAVAVGQWLGASVGDTIAAYTVGVEVGTRLALVAPSEFAARRYHITGIFGSFAACCVAGRLRNVSIEVLQSALGLCGSMAAGLTEFGGSWVKRLHPGWSAYSAIAAIEMASAGFLGPAAVLEGDGGLYQTHVGLRPAPDIFDDTGAVWQTRAVALKPYPCCHLLHAYIDAAIEIRERLSDSKSRIQEIRCVVSPAIVPVVVEPVDERRAPRRAYDALFSLPYVVSVALLRGAVTLESIGESRLSDRDVLSLAECFTYSLDEASEYPKKFSGEVTVVLTDGRTVSATCEHSRGTSTNPMSASDVVEKFVNNACHVVPELVARTIADLVMSNVDEPLDDVIALTSL